MSARDKFITAVMAELGQPVVWGGRDCSELVALGILAASDGKLDQRSTHRAKTYHDETRPLLGIELARKGDLLFYGRVPADPTKSGNHIEHVAIVRGDGLIISADGATSKVTSLEAAKMNPNARVRLHATVHFRSDLVAIHRNTILDSIDFVTR